MNPMNISIYTPISINSASITGNASNESDKIERIILAMIRSRNETPIIKPCA